MTTTKRPLDPRRLRAALPRGFGWIDHRFLSAGYLGRLSPHGRGLYCLLICAADRQGLSCYGDPRLGELLAIDTPTLLSARRELLEAGLIAYQRPLCQVLAFEAQDWSPLAPGQRPTRPASPPPRPPSKAAPPSKPVFPSGLNLRAMVEASLREGGLA